MTAMFSAHACGPALAMGAIGCSIPALLTSASMRPKRSIARSIRWRQSSSRPASPETTRTRRPEASIASPTASRSCFERAFNTTFTPRSPNSRAVAAPSPREAPVTITVCPAIRLPLLFLLEPGLSHHLDCTGIA